MPRNPCLVAGGYGDRLGSDADRDGPTDRASERRLARRGFGLEEGCDGNPDPTLDAAVAADEFTFEDVHRGAADEDGDEEVRRVGVDALRRVNLLRDAVAHDDDAMPHRKRFELIVSNVESGHYIFQRSRRHSLMISPRISTRSFASRLESGSSMT